MWRFGGLVCLGGSARGGLKRWSRGNGGNGGSGAIGASCACSNGGDNALGEKFGVQWSAGSDEGRKKRNGENGALGGESWVNMVGKSPKHVNDEMWRFSWKVPEGQRGLGGFVRDRWAQHRWQREWANGGGMGESDM